MGYKEVYFDLYCKHCDFWQNSESSDVCNHCLNNPCNEDSHKPVNYSGEKVKQIDTFGYYSSIQPIKDYLYEISYDHINYDYAYDYFLKDKDDPLIGACSVFKSGKLVGRNLDWNYSHQSEFLVRIPRINNRYKSYGIGGGLSKLTKTFVDSGSYSDLYKIVPFNMYDGINEYGVYANVNVVPSDYGKNIIHMDLSKYEMNAQMLIRFILDNFQSAKEAVNYIVKHVNLYFSKQLHAMNYEIHYFITDINNSYILEIVNNEYKVIEISMGSQYIPAMTNFHMYGIRLNDDNTVYTPETKLSDKDAHSFNHITLHGSGLERFNLIANTLSRNMSKSDVWNLLNDLKYTKSYITVDYVSNPFWYTEWVSKNGPTVSDDISDFEEIVTKGGRLYSERSRDTGLTWQTVHSVVYDLETKSLEIITQEDGTKLTYIF